MVSLDAHDPRARPVLPGIAGLADRPVDGRRVALVMGGVGLLVALGLGGTIEVLLRSANARPDGGTMLRALAPAPPRPSHAPGHVAVVLVDGMRADEARALPSWRALAPHAVTAQIALATPTLSRPFYHLLLTGVPADASGVRSNRFADRARHPSVADAVRAAGGRVLVVADGLDWMRHMHGRAGDGGTDARGSLGPPLDRAIAAWARAPAPALLVVHTLRVDASAHSEGIDGPAHRAALEQANDVVRRVSAPAGTTLVVLSDHGHRANGGHGGPEPEVATAPLLVRAPGLDSRRLEAAVDPSALAPSIAWWLGVAPPPHAAAAADPRLVSGASSEGWSARARGLVEGGRRASRLRLAARRRFTLPFALVFLLLTLGPIKRAYGFDRSVPIAMLLYPLVAVGSHFALGRPLSLSAIDDRLTHGVRVALIGALAAVVAFAIARASGSGEGATRTRRAAATVGWTATACALLPTAWIGFALGPWPLSPTAFYLPMFALAAGAAALVAAALALFASARASKRAPPAPREA